MQDRLESGQSLRYVRAGSHDGSHTGANHPLATSRANS
jgi:hypothetical protein